MQNLTKQIIQEFQNALGKEGMCDDEAIIAPHLREWRDKYIGHTPLMLLPKSTEEVQAIVKICIENNLKITPQGGNTGLVGAQIPQGEILLSLKRMNQIRAINPNDDCIIAEAGVILQNIHEIANQNNRRFGLSLASQGSATIGGLIATNAGGVHVRKFGMMRQLIMGLEVVLPNGLLYQELNPLRKDNTGYDLKQFFIGSEGTLGIITAACLKLAPNVANNIVAVLGFANSQNAVDCLHFLEEKTGAVSAFEIMNEQSLSFGLKNLPNAKNPLEDINPFTALVEFEGSNENFAQWIEKILWKMFEDNYFLDATIAQNQSQAQEFWALREGMSAAQKPEGKAAKHDISVPISKIPLFLDLAQKAANSILKDVRIGAFGHISDGNIHYDVARPNNMSDDEFQTFVPQINKAVHDVVCSLGGSISAEHGIGIARRDEFLSREPKPHLELMRAIKNAIDPNNIMNPRLG